MLIAIRESEYAYNDGHMCVAKPSEEACVEWVIEKDFEFNGNDLVILSNMAGLHQCEDECMVRQPDCKGTVAVIVNSTV